jgi:N-terminal acetyltransferase B complex non-catalytic subunit
LKPGDDLALLAVHQLLCKYPDTNGSKIACAVLLEKAIEHSPDNAYLKMAAIDIFYELDATSRSWALFQTIGLKHIQLDSCSYTIIPYLSKGGLYNETIEVCNAMLRFQATTARDCGDYAGRAMNAGTLSKADEFMHFQRSKMNKSLSVLEARGMILDAAPLLGDLVPRKRHDEDPIIKGCLGRHQGIVGTESDINRAKQMVPEVYNPYAALSLVSWAKNVGSLQNCEDMADNRDKSILFHQILHKTSFVSKESMITDSIRRGHTHGLLIRASLCLEMTKGPKKGKIVKTSEELAKRTQSFVESVDSTLAFIGQHLLADNADEAAGYKALVGTGLDLCRVLAVISAGQGEPQLQNDSLEVRETLASKILKEKALAKLKTARKNLSPSVKLTCFVLPNYIVPVYSFFRMCSNVCVTFGWGKRKRKTKKCAGALADFASEFDLLIKDLLSCIET